MGFIMVAAINNQLSFTTHFYLAENSGTTQAKTSNDTLKVKSS